MSRLPGKGAVGHRSCAGGRGGGGGGREVGQVSIEAEGGWCRLKEAWPNKTAPWMGRSLGEGVAEKPHWRRGSRGPAASLSLKREIPFGPFGKYLEQGAELLIWPPVCVELTPPNLWSREGSLTVRKELRTLGACFARGTEWLSSEP